MLERTFTKNIDDEPSAKLTSPCEIQIKRMTKRHEDWRRSGNQRAFKSRKQDLTRSFTMWAQVDPINDFGMLVFVKLL